MTLIRNRTLASTTSSDIIRKNTLNRAQVRLRRYMLTILLNLTEILLPRYSGKRWGLTFTDWKEHILNSFLEIYSCSKLLVRKVFRNNEKIFRICGFPVLVGFRVVLRKANTMERWRLTPFHITSLGGSVPRTEPVRKKYIVEEWFTEWDLNYTQQGNQTTKPNLRFGSGVGFSTCFCMRQEQ